MIKTLLEKQKVKKIGKTSTILHDTQLKESGLSSAIVADLMGHADTRMVETVYARTRHEGVMKQLEAVEAINAGITIGL